jgi:hypothetical protein
MSGLNQKGPSGQGPMTGRKKGRCTNFGANTKNQTHENNENSNPSSPEHFQGKGLGKGRGGKGFGGGRQNQFRGGN